jgi:hypothetical protein
MVFWRRRQRSMSTSASRKIPMISSVDLPFGTDLQAKRGQNDISVVAKVLPSAQPQLRHGCHLANVD